MTEKETAQVAEMVSSVAGKCLATGIELGKLSTTSTPYEDVVADIDNWFTVNECLTFEMFTQMKAERGL